MLEWLEVIFDLAGALSMVWLLCEFFKVQAKRDRDARMAFEAFMRMWRDGRK